MSTSPGTRGLRAAMYAALCVLPAIGAHLLATGAAPPIRLQLAAVAVVFAAAFLLGGRERSAAGISGATLSTQGGLHFVFDAGPRHSAMAAQPGTTVVHLSTSAPHVAAVHAIAAVGLSWLMGRGEHAVWSLLRWAVTRVPGLAAWWRSARGRGRLPDAPDAPEPAAPDRSPGSAPLRHSVSRRGPPTGPCPTRRPRPFHPVRRSAHPWPPHVRTCAAPPPSPL